MSGYVELHAHSAYSFLDGASQPEELAARAAELGYEALALTDHDGIYGSLEFAHAAKAFGVRPITGAEVTLTDGSHVTLLVESATGYANLCRLLTAAAVLARSFGRERFFVELQRPYERGDARRLAALRDLAEALGVQTVATGDAHAHHPRRTALQDVRIAMRCRTSLDGCEEERRGNRESVLLAPGEWEERFPHDRDAVARTAELAERLEFDLTEDLGYRYPDFSDTGEPAIRQLARVCDRAFEERYGDANGHKRRARQRLDDELKLIDELGLAE